MLRSSTRRFSTAVVVVLSLLFSQLALANYACPSTGAEPVVDPAPAVMEMAPGQPCTEMTAEEDREVLCHQHCADAPQSFDGLKLPTVSLPLVVVALVLPLVPDTAAQEANARAGAEEAQPPPEPVFLATLRLRV